MMDCLCCFCLEFEEVSNEFCLGFEEVTVVHTGGDVYPGPYEVMPKYYDQVLPTDNKSMIDDVTVKAIPVTYTENDAGGYTVTIG